MVITKTPLRISFAGGGTDIFDYYKTGYGAVFNAAIDKYIWVFVQKSFDGKIHLKADGVNEIVDQANELQHELTKACLSTVGITSGIEIISMSDIPAGTGLGSSSTYTVGLLHALLRYKQIQSESIELKNIKISPWTLAEMACDIEINKLSAPIGKQDQYAAAFGKINYFQFNKNNSVNKMQYKNNRELDKLNKNLIMFYIGGRHNANSILIEQNKNTKKNIECLDKMRDQALTLYRTPQQLPKILQEGWKMKKSLASSITNPQIDKIYDVAISNGAQAGKLLGAGGAGFMIFYCLPERQSNLITSLSSLQAKHLPISIGHANGSELIYGENIIFRQGWGHK